MSQPRKVSVADILSMKGKDRICVLTCYDYSISLICDRAGVDILLVGDSAGMVVLGYQSTVPVQMDEMVTFSAAVSRGARRAMVVGDMPFGSYQSGPSSAIENAIRLVRAGCDAVKLEGGREAEHLVSAISNAGIPVMGHIGLKPQTASRWEGGYRLQGKTAESAAGLVADAKSLERAGAFSIVLEMVTAETSQLVTDAVSIPTIGIGSGPACDGQVLVLHDMLGLYENIRPKFVKRYAELAGPILDAVLQYASEVKTGRFPDESHTFHMNPDEAAKMKKV